MTKKQMKNRVSLTEIAVLLSAMEPAQRLFIWDMFNLFSYEQCEKIFEVALRPKGGIMVTTTKKRKYTRRKKAAKKKNVNS